MRRACLPLATLLLALALPAAVQAKGFSYGVASAEVKPTAAVIWTRADISGLLSYQVATSKGFGVKTIVAKGSVGASTAHDLTAQARIVGLRAGTTYWYRFVRGKERSATGTFKTAPPTTSTKTVRFAWSGDADAQPARGTTKPFYNDFEVYDRMAKERNDFNINLGDTIYSDTEVESEEAGGVFKPVAVTALTLDQKWAKYKQNIAVKALQRFRAATGVYSGWDDHEFVNDFSMAENGDTYKPGVAAFRDYMPTTYTSKDGLYRTFRWGRNAELFFLDERSFRSAKADDACVNPVSGAPDLAPTAPQAVRNVFGAIVSSLKQLVSASCLAAINDPSRTFLGSRQYARFTKDIKASKATFKIVINETPIQQFYALPFDRWEGYEAERQKLLNFLKANVKNVVFLTTDTHGNLVNDARLKTLEPGGPVNSGILDVVTGPVATRTFDKEIDAAIGRAGSGEAVRGLFFKGKPPNGPGMLCASTDVYSYGEVTVTSKKLTIALKNIKGKPVTEPLGKPCGPFVIKKR